MKNVIIFLIIIFSVLSSVHAKTIKVPEEQNTIAKAIRAASDGDTILVAHGTYTQSELIKVNKAVTVASRFIYTNRESDINNTIINAASNHMEEWFELSADNSIICGITFRGNDEHTLNITASYASVTFCKFLGGKDQLSVSGGGGYIGHCYFENAGDDAIDCDNSVSWIIEYNTIVNAHQDGIEVRLHKKKAPLTTHIFRYNTVIGSGESGIQLIDYQENSYREFYIHNNVFQNCRGSGISCMYQEKDNTNEVYKGSLMEEKAFVYNNTFTGCNYGLTISPNLMIINNIFTHIKTNGIERGAYVNDRIDNSIVDYCLFYENSQHYDSDIKIGKHIFLNQKPLLDDTFKLKVGSPCIDAGMPNYKWNQSILEIPNTEYTGCAPDLGANEYGINFPATTNNVPVVDAGKDMVIVAPVNHTSLNGSVTGGNKKTTNALSLKWSKISGPGEVMFSNAVNPATTATFSQQGTYELMLSGSNTEYRVNDIVKVCYVKDYVDRSVNVGIGNDVFLEAEDYRYLVGAAKVELNNKVGGKVVRSQNHHNEWTCTEYQISTQSAGTCYIWIRFSGNSKSKSNLYVSFNDLTREQQISGPADEKWEKDSWQKVVFPGTPEGSYPLRIRADKPGVMWDKIFITFDVNKHP